MREANKFGEEIQEGAERFWARVPEGRCDRP
jgi:hypothetical protein